MFFLWGRLMEPLDSMAYLADEQSKRDKAKRLRQLRLGNFYSAWQFLDNHPIFIGSKNYGEFVSKCLRMHVNVTNANGFIEDDKSKNTRVSVWMECWPMAKVAWSPFLVPSYDPALQCEGRTFEKAIVKMAKLVFKYYGDGQ